MKVKNIDIDVVENGFVVSVRREFEPGDPEFDNRNLAMGHIGGHDRLYTKEVAANLGALNTLLAKLLGEVKKEGAEEKKKGEGEEGGS